MAQGKAEDAGGLTPAKDDNTALYHFAPRTLPIFKCVDYIGREIKIRQGQSPCHAFGGFPIAIIRIAGKCRAGRPRPAVLPQTARRVVAPYGAPLSATTQKNRLRLLSK